MFLLVVPFLFLLACAGAWLLLFPSGREIVGRNLLQWNGQLNAKIKLWQLSKFTQSRRFLASLRAAANELRRFFRQHRIVFFMVFPIIFLPPLIVLLLAPQSRLETFDVPIRDENQQISALLTGEQLAPPAALPPEVFVSEEINLIRPMLVDASRNWSLLNADFRQRLLLTFKIMKEKHGYEMAILEGYRSPERQNALAKLGSNVTNATAYQSYHQYGLAADCAFYRDGKLIISEKDPWAMQGYKLYGEVAESVGLTWGGRWKMMDFGHTELRLNGTLKK